MDSTQTAIAHNEAFEYEYRIATRDNGQRWVWERGHQSKKTDGDIIHLDGFISDVTERKETENNLVYARAFADAVVDSAAEAVITIDHKGSIETFNRAAQRMFGYSIEEAQGQNVRGLMTDPDRCEHDNYISRYLETNEARIIGIGREV